MAIHQLFFTARDYLRISNINDFNNLTQVGSVYIIKSLGSSVGLTTTVNNAPNGRKGINLGSFSFVGTTYSVGQDATFPRTLVTETYNNLSYVSQVFQGGRLVWTALSGVSELNYDFYSIDGSFGCVASGTARSGITNTYYEQTVNSHSYSSVTNTFTLRYKTDLSQNGGNGWYNNSGNLWFSI